MKQMDESDMIEYFNNVMSTNKDLDYITDTIDKRVNHLYLLTSRIYFGIINQQQNN